MTVRLYKDGGRQLQLYATGDSDVPDCMWHFLRGAYVLLFHVNEPEDEEDEEYGDEVFLIGLDYGGAYRKAARFDPFPVGRRQWVACACLRRWAPSVLRPRRAVCGSDRATSMYHFILTLFHIIKTPNLWCSWPKPDVPAPEIHDSGLLRV